MILINHRRIGRELNIERELIGPPTLLPEA
jgi:hypothetical protein